MTDTEGGAPGSPPALERGRLGALARIAAGGQGVTYDAPGVHLGFAASAVFKEYRTEVLPDVDVAQLATLPGFLLEQPGAIALRLVSVCAWPCATVSDGARTVGFVMPRIPDRFYIDMTTVRGVQRRTAEFQHLLNDDEYLAQRGIPLTDRDRYRLIGAVANQLGFLHSLGVVVGDMSPKNMMFSLAPDAAVYFIDADAMRVRGASVAPQVESPGWSVPAGEELATEATDRYKLGLLALRLLAGDQDTRTPLRLPGGTPSAIVDLVTRSLSDSPAERPAPSDWGPAAIQAARIAQRSPRAAPTTGAGAHSLASDAAARSGGSPPTPPPGGGAAGSMTGPQYPSFTPRTPGPGYPAKPRPSGAVLAAVCLVAVVVIVAVIIVAATASGGGDSSTSAAGTSISTTTVAYPTTYATTTTRTTTRTTTTTTTTTRPPRTSENPPEKTSWCPGELYSVNTVTTCGFARNVYLAVSKSELPKVYTGIASPSRSDRTFDMVCDYTSSTSSLVACTGGDGAAVYIF